jgi:hypothetical protein
MTKEVKEFEIRPTISPSDKEFRNKVGTETWERIKSKTFRDDNFKCKGCGFEPYDVSADEVMDVHLVEENLENPEESKFITVCKLCHIIEHGDYAINQGFVSIVNSFFRQGELVNICRNGGLSTHIENGDIRILKKPLNEFLEELKNGRALEGKVKFIFTEKYLKLLGINSF